MNEIVTYSGTVDHILRQLANDVEFMRIHQRATLNYRDTLQQEYDALGQENAMLHTWIEDYRDRIRAFEEEVLPRAEYDMEGNPINWAASLIEYTGLLPRDLDAEDTED